MFSEVRPPGSPSSREVYFLLWKDRSAITNNPNVIIRLSDSKTVIASPPFLGDEPTTLEADSIVHPYYTITKSCANMFSYIF
jgi:hypothetical protein